MKLHARGTERKIEPSPPAVRKKCLQPRGAYQGYGSAPGQDLQILEISLLVGPDEARAADEIRLRDLEHFEAETTPRCDRLAHGGHVLGVVAGDEALEAQSSRGDLPAVSRITHHDRVVREVHRGHEMPVENGALDDLLGRDALVARQVLRPLREGK